MEDRPDDDSSYIDLPGRASRRPRWAAVSGRHHVPTLGTLVYRKRWYAKRVRVRFRTVGATRWQSGSADWTTIVELITAGTLGEARTLVSWCLSDDR
ncbi:hypothetical protein [Streptomyces sp. CC208A]|uniref:hypothetical protein n=1 Tax=Streptomyces sp. CC208A TaxID=3044573 RepID=UPI0024A7EB95|nr:hypothetical protein [Streptomyces sp. CC208A]